MYGRISVQGKKVISSLRSSIDLGVFTSGLGPAPAFNPADISGLVLWLKSSSLDSLADGTTIDTWIDSSSSVQNATGTSTSRPTKQTNSGKSVARFDGSNDNLINTGLSAIAAGDFHIFIVVKRNGGTGFRTIFSLGNVGAGDVLISAANTSNDWYVNPAGSGTNVDDGVNTDATLELGEIKCASGTVSVKKKGGSTTSGALTLNAGLGYVIGDFHDLNQPYPGDIYEILVYNTALSAGNVTNIENYYNNLFGV